MADVWFYAQNGQQTGPVSESYLRQLAQRGGLRIADLVWKEGLPQWVRADSIAGLFPVQAELVSAEPLTPAGRLAGFDYGQGNPLQDPFGDSGGDAVRQRRAPQGWEALPAGAKLGIMVGGLVLVVLAVAVPVMIYRSGGSAGPDDGDKTISGRLSSWDSTDRVRGGCPARVFNYRMKAGTTYTIRLLSNQFDTYLRLEDPAGNNVAEDDDGDAPGMSLNAKLVYTAPTDGTYRIVATSFMPTRGGNFQLLVTRATPAAPTPAKKADGKSADALPAPGDDGQKTYSGQLTRFDAADRLRPASRSAAYSYRMKAGTTYTIRMTAATRGFDPYLRLENPFGLTVAQDDDGDGFPNARITYLCPQDGSYRIVATSFDASLGSYTVSVTPSR